MYYSYENANTRKPFPLKVRIENVAKKNALYQIFSHFFFTLSSSGFSFPAITTSSTLLLAFSAVPGFPTFPPISCFSIKLIKKGPLLS
jgi:hypothetical protein